MASAHCKNPPFTQEILWILILYVILLTVIIDSLFLSTTTIKDFIYLNKLSISSLDKAIDDCDGQPICLRDLLRDSADNALNLIEKKELKQEIIEAILKLSDREMIILHFYYNITTTH